MNNNIIIPFFLFMGFLVGCGKETQDPHVSDLQKTVANETAVIANLQNQVANLAVASSNQANCILVLWNQSLYDQTNFNRLQSAFYGSQFANNSVSITPESKGYGLQKTPFGTLLISTESVEPYLDGYKIHLKIGNPTSADFTGFSLVCSSYQTTNVFGTLQTSTNSFTEKLTSRYWTPIDFILAPANADRLRNTSVSIELNELILLDKKNSQAP